MNDIIKEIKKIRNNVEGGRPMYDYGSIDVFVSLLNKLPKKQLEKYEKKTKYIMARIETIGAEKQALASEIRDLLECLEKDNITALPKNA